MSFPNKRHLFTSKRDAMSKAKRVHCCTSCLYFTDKVFDVCPQCGANGNIKKKANMRVYFPSKSEHLRAAQLIQMQKAGQISGIKFHPRYDLIVNGHKISAYEADVSYFDSDGKQIIEDTKPSGTDFVDDLAEIKIALFNALYEDQGLKVKIYRSY